MTTPDQPESNPHLPPPPGTDATDAARWSQIRPPSGSTGGQPTSPSLPPKKWTWTTVAVIAVSAVGWLAYNHFSSGQSPEGDIRAVVKAFTDDWNKPDVTAIRSLWCSGTAPDATILSKQIDWYGHIETSVSDIGGSGDKASAEVTVTSSNTGGEKEPWYFLNEGGSWKPCKTSFLWTRAH
jgi:hypothetical protein